MPKIIDAKDGFFFLRVVGLDSDRDVFLVMNFDSGKEVAGCTGGAAWSLAQAATAIPITRTDSATTTFIVLDCII